MLDRVLVVHLLLVCCQAVVHVVHLAALSRQQLAVLKLLLVQDLCRLPQQSAHYAVGCGHAG